MADPTLPPEPNVVDRRGKTPRQRVLARNSSLRNILSSYLAHWRDLNDFILPRRLSYLASDKNDGSKKNGQIIRNTATRAARILAAGKMAGQTSPVRPWVRLQPPDDLKNVERVVRWVSEVERIVYRTLARSNLYAKIHEMWFEQGVFGTSVLFIEEDEEDDIRGTIFPLGQYALGSTKRGRVDTCYRDFSEMSVEEVVREFGLAACSPQLKLAWQNGEYEKRVAIIHRMEPNLDRDTGKIDNANMQWRSDWWEKEADDSWGLPLRSSGFPEQPFVVARWNVLGGDLYGSDCPGMDALGDTKGLQHMAKRRAEIADNLVKPALKAPTSAKTSRLSLLPNDATYVDEAAAGTKLEPIINVKPEGITVAEGVLADDDRRIFSTFFADLFQMFLLDDAQQPRTATDINKRYEEKMLQLGPVTELDVDEVLDPMLNRIVQILGRRGKLPPVPPELVGRRVQTEYISIMATAQKLLGTAASERFLSIIGSVSAIDKKVLDIPNMDKIIRNYAEMLGMKPEEVNPDEVVQALRQARQQQEQAQQAIVAAQGMAQAGKTAADAQMTPDSMLSRLLAGTGLGGPTAYSQV